MSFSIDMASILTVAVDLFNALFPIMIWPLGIIFALGLLGWIFNILRKFFKFSG